MQRVITDDLDLLLDALPPHICSPLKQREDNFELLEIVMDLGRRPEARYPGREVLLSQLMGTLQSPMAGLLGVLNGTLQSLLGLLEARREQMEQAEA